MMRPSFQLRQVQSSFDPNAFYTFRNNVLINETLSLLVGDNANGGINMMEAGSYSNENWQIYWQQGRYFLRNRDYGAGYQLGLDKSSLSVPRLMQASGALGQQWTLAKADGGLWKFTNGLLGNDTALGLSGGNTVPGMNPSDDGTSWAILLNPSAGAAEDIDKNMLKDVANFEVVTSSSSIAIPSATSSPLSTASQSVSPTLSSIPVSIATSTASTPASTPNSASKGSSISPGAIAGIVVGVLLLFVILSLATYHLLSRRKQKKDGAELGGYAIQPPTVKYLNVHPIEIG